MSQETVLLFANEAFYLTFTTRDADAMDAIWSAREDVTCVHPGWQPLIGRNEVMRSWRNILSNPKAPKIECEHVWAHVAETIAYVLCNEVMAEGQLAATNIFTLEDGAWKIIHHQAGPMPNTARELTKKTPVFQ